MKQLFQFIYALAFIQVCAIPAQAQSSSSEKQAERRRKTHPRYEPTVLIEYNCAAQRFDSLPPACIREYSQVVVRYTHVNPFLHNSNLKIEEINHQYEDGMSAFKSVEETTEGEIGATDTSKMAIEMILSENNIHSHPGDEKFYSIGSPDNNKRNQAVLTIKDKVQSLVELQRLLAALESTIYSIGELVRLDTIIKIARKNEYNRSSSLMKSDINSRITFNIDKGSDIQIYFNDYVNKIHKQLADVQIKLSHLEDVHENLNNLLGGSGFDRALSAIKIDIDKIKTAYTGTNLEKLAAIITGITNNYQNTVGAEYIVYGDSVLCARGDYLQIKDIGMGIDFRPIKIKGGSRIDFSVGVALSMGDITGWNYSLSKVNDSTTYLITDKENRTVVPSPVVMMHWYATSCRHASLMLSLGVSPDIATLSDTRFFLGASLATFSSNNVMRRFIFSAGIACGAADVLKAKYRNKDREPDNNFHSFGNVSDNDLTEKSYRVGGFVSFTWNLGGTGH